MKNNETESKLQLAAVFVHCFTPAGLFYRDYFVLVCLLALTGRRLERGPSS